VIISVIGVPGAIIGGFMVDFPFLGRRGTLSLSTRKPIMVLLTLNNLCIVLTGIFLFASTTARHSNALLGWNCAYSFTSNIMYGVLYAMTVRLSTLVILPITDPPKQPELFPTKDRGTGTGLAGAYSKFVIIASSDFIIL
jgi:hypothetical protein